MDTDKKKELEARIADLKSRLPGKGNPYSQNVTGIYPARILVTSSH